MGCRWVGIIPTSCFILHCCAKRRELINIYKTTIIFAAMAQLIMSLPISLYYTFLSFFTGRDIQSTALVCTLVHSTGSITESSAHLVIPTVAIGRFIGVVIGQRLGISVLIAILILITMPHVAAVYLTVINGVPVPNPDCQPVLFFSDRNLRPIYNYYLYVPPIIAVAFNLLTLFFVLRNKPRQQGSQASRARARDELVVTLGLLAQSIVPAITISSRAYFMFIKFFLIDVPKVLETIVEYTSYFTVGLNTIASIAFIKPFRLQFMALVGRPFARKYRTETSVVSIKFRSL